VLNLSGDKPKVLAESARVLRPADASLSPMSSPAPTWTATRGHLAAYTGGIAGALTEDEFRDRLTAAGFVDVEIRDTHRVHKGASSAIICARKPTDAHTFSHTTETEPSPDMVRGRVGRDSGTD
jgi:hypothetical protein